MCLGQNFIETSGILQTLLDRYMYCIYSTIVKSQSV